MKTEDFLEDICDQCNKGRMLWDNGVASATLANPAKITSFRYKCNNCYHEKWKEITVKSERFGGKWEECLNEN